MIAVAACRKLEVYGHLISIGLIGPGQVRRGGLFAGGHQGNDGCVVSAERFSTFYLRPDDFCYGITFADTRRYCVNSSLHHLLHDFPSLVHVFDLLIRLDQSDPTDQQISVDKCGILQVVFEGFVPAGTEVVSVQFRADPFFPPFPLFDNVGYKVHGMPFRGLNVVIRVTNDVLFRQEGCVTGTGCIHLTANP